MSEIQGAHSASAILAFIKEMVGLGFISVQADGVGGAPPEGYSVALAEPAIQLRAAGLMPSVALRKLVVVLADLGGKVGAEQKRVLGTKWPNPQTAQMAFANYHDQVARLCEACQKVGVLAKYEGGENEP